MYKGIKSVLDKILAGVGLLVLAPVLVVVMILIIATDGRPLFYRQTRVGYKLQRFDLLKFRTLTVNKERDPSNAHDPANFEITGVGAVLRRFKIDEVPQLFNVIKGDMSLVGPRPPLPALLSEMDEAQKLRFNVLPGLTGLAQVNGNIHIEWEQRFKYDLQYVNNVSFLMDLKIVFKTILVVVFGEDKFKSKSE